MDPLNKFPQLLPNDKKKRKNKRMEMTDDLKHWGESGLA